MLKLTFKTKTKTKTLSLKTKTKTRTLKFNTQTESKTLKISSLDSQDRQQVDLWLTTHTVAYQLQQGCLQWTELKILVMRATLCHQTNAERKRNVLITVHFNTRFVHVQITKYHEGKWMFVSWRREMHDVQPVCRWRAQSAPWQHCQHSPPNQMLKIQTLEHSRTLKPRIWP